MEKISKEHAKSIILRSQLLTDDKRNKSNKGLLETIDQLGYVQIDTISVIERSHNHTLWTRLPDYYEAELLRLQSDERSIFEYWAHAMAYLPMKDYRYYLSRMENFRNPSHKWIKNNFEKCKNLLEPILKRIKEEGPLSSKDFEDTRNNKGTWWDWKPAKIGLELLFWRGDIMIAERKKFQKYYDLTERVLPSNISTQMPSEAETADYIVMKAIEALGIASEKCVQKFLQPDAARDSDWRAVSKNAIRNSLNQYTEEKSIIEVSIKDQGNEVFYTTHKNMTNKIKPNNSLHLLSPFDNLVIQRNRVKQLFDFDYSLECYVPQSKRVFGYFVLPILYKNNFEARADIKADRKKKILLINNFHFEDNFKCDENFVKSCTDKLLELAKFNKCEQIEIINSNKHNYISQLKTAIEKFS